MPDCLIKLCSFVFSYACTCECVAFFKILPIELVNRIWPIIACIAAFSRLPIVYLLCSSLKEQETEVGTDDESD